jgi:hypothetical protein
MQLNNSINQTSTPESLFLFFPFDTAEFDILNLLVKASQYKHTHFYVNKAMKALHSNRRIVRSNLLNNNCCEWRDYEKWLPNVCSLCWDLLPKNTLL